MLRPYPIICGFCLLVVSTGLAADPPAKVAGSTKLDGAWRLVGYKTAEATDYVKVPADSNHVKLVVGGRFTWTDVKDGKVLRSAGGRVDVTDDVYTERVEFVQADTEAWMVGGAGTFKWKLEGDKWTMQGVFKGNNNLESRIDEIWERVK